MVIQNKRLIVIPISVGLILLIPLIAMQFTSQVTWSPFDFLVMGILLLGTGLMGELGWRTVKTMKHRVMLLVAILSLFFFIWAELAVGIFGTPFAGS